MHVLLLLLALAGFDAEDFLRTAEVVSVKELDMDSTAALKMVELSKDGETRRAVWKNIEDQHGYIRDSWRHEIAAYKFSKYLKLDVFPPTVEREIEGEVGSLQLWIEGCTTKKEWESDRKQVDPTELIKVRVFILAIGNVDGHSGNMLVCEDGKKMYAIDASRAFQDRSRLYFYLEARP